MDPSFSGDRLHKIGPLMSFGHTSYVPDEETRNLCASFPEPDSLQQKPGCFQSELWRRETIAVTDKLLYGPDQAALYCTELSTSTLSHPDYRKLAWQSSQQEVEKLVTPRRAKGKKTASPPAKHSTKKKEITPAEFTNAALEARYRATNAIPFRIDPKAAYLIQHSSIVSHRKRLLQDYNTDLFFLNDRSHFDKLERQLATRWELESEAAHRTRCALELQKSKNIAAENDEELTIALPPISHKKRGLKKHKAPGFKPFSVKQQRAYRWPQSTSVMDATTGQMTMPEVLIEDIGTEGQAGVGTEVADGMGADSRDGSPHTALKSYDSKLIADQSDLILPQLDMPVRASVLMARLSMNSLYDNAKELIKPKSEFDRHTLKYKNLTWDRVQQQQKL